MMHKRLAWLTVIAVVLALAAIGGMFLTYVGHTEERRTYLSTDQAPEVFDKVTFDMFDYIEMSLIEYVIVYGQAGEELFHNNTYAIAYTIFFALPGIFGVLALLFALGRKGIPLMLMGALIGLSMWGINFDVVDRGIMPFSGNVWGIPHYGYYVIGAAIFICGLAVSITKHQIKRQKRIKEER